MAKETEDAKDTKTETKIRYKYCVVPKCKSTTVRTPRKLFFSIPSGEQRERWCEAMGRRAPQFAPLSASCNRFCCEDHFDLENDMANYMRWRLMGKDTKKLILKKGVVPHKFDCQSDTTAEQVKETILAGTKKDQLEETELPLDQRLKKVRKNTVNSKKRKRADEKQLQETRKEEKVSEEEKISEQRKKIGRLSKRATEVSSREPEIETYTFEIKVEAEDYYELNDGDSILEEFLSRESQSAAPDNSHLVDVNVKVETLDEEFEPELVEEKTQINVIEE